ncbi:hypothetical protein [Haloarcula laminariae]|uniref:hypothetical protein n=1 Tax=Haloarcula laminariae TaxID=2961577 RepID=UPI0024052F27|nr:hypothetical protein [Halomicroarcula sp. FL173]
MLTDTARLYSDVFAPELFVLLCGACLIGYEWYGLTDRSPVGLGARFGVLALGWAVGLAIYEGVPVLFESAPAWAPDATGSLGLGVGILVIWLGWRRFEWGSHVPVFSALLVGVTVPHLLITPFWDISTHVLYAVVPAGYLVRVDRRFAPLALVALGMVFARPLAGAHTWPQSVAGLVLGVAFVAASHRYDSQRSAVPQ